MDGSGGVGGLRARQFGVTTVAVLVVLLVAMSGTAVATTALLVTKNKQVAAHVIAGANAPRGDNQNIIAGSVGSSDLHSGAVSSSKLAAGAVTGRAVANGSLTGADLAAGSVDSSKLTLPSFNASSAATDTVNTGPAPVHNLVSASGLSLAYDCALNGNTGAVSTELLASSTASGATFNGVALTGTLSVVKSFVATGATSSESLFLTYLQGSHVTLVHLDSTTTSFLTGGTCQIDGLLLPSN
jgi:hypothetical protein